MPQSIADREIGFEIETLTDEENPDTAVKLKKPMKIKLRKTQVQISYKLTYIQNFNFGPIEEVIGSDYISCSQGIFVGAMRVKDATCTIQYEDSKVIPDSQGYCCSCPILSVLVGLRGAGSTRGDCGFMSSPRSAHCLNYPNKWYAGYRVIFLKKINIFR